MEEAVDAFLQLDEGAGGGELDDLARQAHAHGILLGDLVPGIVLDLLEAEGDLAGLEVVVEDHALDGIADVEHLLGLANLAHPGELGDVGEALDPFLDLDEGAVVGELGDLAVDDVADMVALLEGGPGIGSEVLEGKVDPPLLGLHPDDLELDLLALLDEILGPRDVAPAHVVDMQEAVEAAEVDEGAEGGEALDLALDRVADLGASGRNPRGASRCPLPSICGG